MAEERKYFNTTTGPLRIDYLGHTVGGGEWFDSKETPEIRTYLATGDVVDLTPEPEKKTDPEEDSSKTTGKK